VILQEIAKCDKNRQNSQNSKEKRRSNCFNIFIWNSRRKTRFRIFLQKERAAKKSREKSGSFK